MSEKALAAEAGRTDPPIIHVLILSVRRWRRQLHVVVALPLLAKGRTVQAVADHLGYDSAGAFVTMFRKTVGAPPKRFLAERGTLQRASDADDQRPQEQR
ncbi:MULTISPECIES: helix-turn-helix domain-containing protein [Stenotrophomonas]|uniref:helix-turn-helix domain-containing protein n=1 Tax=Stenotrophomonas TaxID=40323 RepID=UPI001312D2EF|nr:MULTISPECIES: helix-turn-helix domain-containing protein [Stenotrophomonas]MDZ5831018.1 helix-turn-helix domain-containing protein [Stenotrophomonas maltophilia]